MSIPLYFKITVVNLDNPKETRTYLVLEDDVEKFLTFYKKRNWEGVKTPIY